ncbi:MAG: hypothetical protein ISP45_04090 [Reyranella sp.]|nr:hypothetical protein [Reyranella sp.]
MRTTEMSGTTHIIVPRRKKSELQQFALWFHQDWKLVFRDFNEGAELYIRGLPSKRKEILRRELSAFVLANEEHPAEMTKRAWFGLGAQAWQSNLDILPTLKRFVDLLAQSGNSTAN